MLAELVVMFAGFVFLWLAACAMFDAFNADPAGNWKSFVVLTVIAVSLMSIAVISSGIPWQYAIIPVERSE